MAHKGHWQHARREAIPADRQHARREVCAFGLRLVSNSMLKAILRSGVCVLEALWEVVT